VFAEEEIDAMAEPDGSHGKNGSNGTPRPFGSEHMNTHNGSTPAPDERSKTPRTRDAGLLRNDTSSTTWPPPAGTDERNWWTQHAAPSADIVSAVNPQDAHGNRLGGVSANSDWWSANVHIDRRANPPSASVSETLQSVDHTVPPGSASTPDAASWWSGDDDCDDADAQWWSQSLIVPSDGITNTIDQSNASPTASDADVGNPAETPAPARATQSHGRPPLSALVRIDNGTDTRRVEGHFSVAGTATRADDGLMTRVMFDTSLARPLRGWCLAGSDTLGPYVLEISIEAAVNCGDRDIEVFLEDAHPHTPSGFTVMLRARGSGPYAVSGTYRIETH